MLKFVIDRREEHEVKNDFVFFLLEAIEYHEWYSNTKIKVRSHRSSESFYLREKIIKSEKLSSGEKYVKEDPKDYIPIGDVRFVCDWTKDLFGISPFPINIPEDLNKESFLGRKIIKVKNSYANITGEFFIKQADVFKGKTDIINIYKGESFFDGEWLISEVIDIDSEWRIFVFRGEIVGAKNYLGDPFLSPDRKVIEKMISCYSGPVSYTLDVAVNNNGTFLIEVHDFFGCGLYGLDRPDILPFMYSQWYKEFLRKNEVN